MKRFEFRLEAVLRFYEMHLDMERARLAQYLAEEQRILNTIAQRAEEVNRQNQAIREMIELRSGDLRSLSVYNLVAQTQSIVLNEELARVRRLIRSQRDSVLREQRKVKLVSKLRERKAAEWKADVDRKVETEAQEVWRAIHQNALSHRPAD